MERQGAYSLFTAFLQKKGCKEVELKKELPELLAYGLQLGCFVNPHTVHAVTEWRKFGDKIQDALLDDDKIAKKWGKKWRVVINLMLQHEAERRAVEHATDAQLKNQKYADSEWLTAPGLSSGVLGKADSYGPDADQGAVGGTSGGDVPKQKPPFPSSADEWPDPPPAVPSAPILPASAQSEPSAMPRVSFPGALSDLAEAVAKERREAWAAVSQHCLETEGEAPELAIHQAFPVVYNLNGQGQITYEIKPLDWKLLTQLRATVNEYGLHGEPTKQILDYMFNSQLLLPADLRAIARLLLSQHQQLLFNSHWQMIVYDAVAVQRQPGDPLYGVTAEELMGLGPYLRSDTQVYLGPDKLREAMRLARRAIENIKEPGGPPMYMSIKQQKNEAFGTFVDRLTTAITKAGVSEWMKGAILKQWVLQNASADIKRLIAAEGPHWTIEGILEKSLSIPVGDTAFLVNSLRDLTVTLQQQSQGAQQQVLAALAPLQGLVSTTAEPRTRQRCYRCGFTGHFRKDCRATGTWCSNCKQSSHNAAACRNRPGNSKRSASHNSSRALTQIAAAATRSLNSTPPPLLQ
ncbi:GAK8 protein, partial [Piprites chloris]|nr:GAK8 protein [Piprites chloris]